MKLLDSYKTLSLDDIQYIFQDDGNIEIKPTVMRGSRRVLLGRPFKYDGRKHHMLMNELPDVFPDLFGTLKYSIPPFASKLSDSDIRHLGFRWRRDLNAFLQEHSIRDISHLRELRQGVEPIWRDVTKTFKAADWIALGFPTRAAGEAWRRRVLEIVPKVLDTREEIQRWVSRLHQSTFHIDSVTEFMGNHYGATHHHEINHTGMAFDAITYLDALMPKATGLIREFQSRNNPDGEMGACAFNINLEVMAVQLNFTDPDDDDLMTIMDHIQDLFQPGDFTQLREYLDKPEVREALTSRNLLNAEDVVFSGKMVPVYGDNAVDAVDGVRRQLDKHMDEMCEQKGSGWTILWVNRSFLNLVEREPLTGSSWFRMPDWIFYRRAVMNVRNTDLYCGLYSAIYGKHWEELSDDARKRITPQVRGLLKHYMQKGLETIPAPLPLSRKVWNQVEDIMEVNIWIWQAINTRETFVPFTPSPMKYSRDILLVHVRNPDNPIQTHYVWAAHPSRLVHANCSSDNMHYPCFKCTMPKTSEAAAKEHQRRCILLEGALERMPAGCGKQHYGETDEDYLDRVEKAGRPKLQFSAWHAILDVPAFITYDFEADNARPGASKEKTKSQIIFNHRVNSGQVTVYDNVEGKVLHYEIFKGDNPVREVLDAIKYWSAHINDKYFREQVDIMWTPESRVAYEKSTTCCICHGDLRVKPDEMYDIQSEFLNEVEDDDEGWVEHFSEMNGEMHKVAHHNHYNGEVFGAAHKSCNLKVRVVRRVPVLAHNMSGYDGNFLLSELKMSDYHRMDVLPINSLKNKAFTLTMRGDDTTSNDKRLPYDTEMLKFRPKDETAHTLLCKKQDLDILRDRGYYFQSFPLHDNFMCISSRKVYWDVVKEIRAARAYKRSQYKIEFKDSLLFLQDSLDKVTSSLRDEDFTATWTYVDYMMEKYNIPAERREETFKICRQKSGYPYEWRYDMRSTWSETEVPGPEAFFSTLSTQCPSWEALNAKPTMGTNKQKQAMWRIKKAKRAKIYAARQSVVDLWEYFGFKTFGEAHDHYLHMDCFLLTDALLNFRRTFRKNFDLDPLHFATFPGANWQAALKDTRAKTELFGPNEHDMYQMGELMIRGGVSTVGTLRYARANNPLLQKYGKHLYDPKKPTTYLIYIDANGLYAHIMASEKLPCGDYRWVVIHAEQILELDTEGDVGRVFEVNAQLPRCVTHCEAYKRWKAGKVIDRELQRTYERFEGQTHDEGCLCLHDYQAEFPCLPGHHVTQYGDLSKQQKEWCRSSGGDMKLTPTLLPKTEYKVHLKVLQFAMRHGWEVTKVHRVLEFQQRAWLQPFIKANNARRTAAKKAGDTYQSNVMKLSSNSCYGKLQEDVRKYKKMVIIKREGDEKHFKRCINDPKFLEGRGIHPINDEISMLEMGQHSVLLNKPILAGATVTDLSKLHMQRFFYDVLKRKFGNKVKMVMTDTDSFILQIEGEDVYEFMQENPDIFSDTIPGAFKLEHTVPILEVAAIRSKVYSIQLADAMQKSTAKGVNKGAKDYMMHNMYVETCLKGTTHEAQGYNIRACNHRRADGGYDRQVRIEAQTKLALSPFNDKAYLCPDGTQLPWGHGRIEQLRALE